MIKEIDPRSLTFEERVICPKEWKFFEVTSTVGFDLYQFEAGLFKTESIPVAVIKTPQDQYIILIKEHSIYSKIYKSEIILGYTDYTGFTPYIYKLDDGTYWNDKEIKGSRLKYSLVTIRHNEVLFLQLLSDLYDFLTHPLIDQLLTRIDQLLLELNGEQKNNEIAGKILNDQLKLTLTEGELPCEQTLQGCEDLKTD